MTELSDVDADAAVEIVHAWWGGLEDDRPHALRGVMSTPEDARDMLAAARRVLGVDRLMERNERMWEALSKIAGENLGLNPGGISEEEWVRRRYRETRRIAYEALEEGSEA